jgi:hypothetical protein
MNRQPPCKNHQEGRCKFGSRCRYDHTKKTGLVDPPKWVFSTFFSLDSLDISYDEVRYRFMELRNTPNGMDIFQSEWDNAWKMNYIKFYDLLDKMCSEGKVKSWSERCVDLRKDPSVFLPPIDYNRVMDDVLKGRKNMYSRGGGFGFQGRSHEQFSENRSYNDVRVEKRPPYQNERGNFYSSSQNNLLQGSYHPTIHTPDSFNQETEYAFGSIPYFVPRRR